MYIYACVMAYFGGKDETFKSSIFISNELAILFIRTESF